MSTKRLGCFLLHTICALCDSFARSKQNYLRSSLPLPSEVYRPKTIVWRRTESRLLYCRVQGVWLAQNDCRPTEVSVVLLSLSDYHVVVCCDLGYIES